VPARNDDDGAGPQIVGAISQRNRAGPRKNIIRFVIALVEVAGCRRSPYQRERWPTPPSPPVTMRSTVRRDRPGAGCDRDNGR